MSTRKRYEINCDVLYYITISPYIACKITLRTILGYGLCTYNPMLAIVYVSQFLPLNWSWFSYLKSNLTRDIMSVIDHLNYFWCSQPNQCVIKWLVNVITHGQQVDISLQIFKYVMMQYSYYSLKPGSRVSVETISK